MASAYGIVHQYGEPDSLFNPELAAGVLQHKQEKYDSNIIKVEQTLQQLGLSTAMMVRPEDQEYMYERVNNLIQSIPNISDADFSSNEVTRGIISNVNQAIDERVVRQLGNSKKLRDFEANVQEIRESGEGYSDTNYQYALIKGGYEDYMSGKSQDLKNLSYTPYTNVTEELLANIEKAKKSIGEQEIDFQDVDGVMKKRKISNMTISEWMTFMPNLITPQMQEQMQIDGAARFQFSDENAKQQALETKNNIEKPFNEKIAKYDLILKTNKDLNASQRALLKKERDNLKKQKEASTQGLNPEKVTAENLGFQSIYAQTVSDYAGLVGSDPSLTFLNTKKFADGKMPGSQQESLDAMGVQAVSALSAADGLFKDLEVEDFEAKQVTARDSFKEGWLTPGEIQARNYKKNNYDFETEVGIFKNKGLAEEDAKYQAVKKMYEAEGNFDKISEGEKLQRNYKNTVQAQEVAHNQLLSKDYVLVNADKIYKSLTEKGIYDRQVIVVNGKEIPTKDYLEQEKIDTPEKFREFVESDKAKPILSAIYADFTLASTNTNALGATSSLSSIFNRQGTFISEISKEDIHNINRLGLSLGIEDLHYSDVFDVFETNKPVIASTGMPFSESKKLSKQEVDKLSKELKFRSNLVVQVKEDAPTEVVNILKQRAKYTNKAQGTSNPLSGVWAGIVNKAEQLTQGDRNFHDDKTLRDLFSYSSSTYEKAYKDALSQAEITVNTPKKITLRGAMSKDEVSTIAFKLQAATLDSETEGQYKYDPLQPSEVMIDPQNPSTVLIMQKTEKDYLDEKKNLGRAGLTTVARVEATQLEQLVPELYNLIDFEKVAGQVNVKTKVDEVARITSYLDDSDEQRFTNYYNYTGNETAAIKASQGGAKQFLRSNFRQLFQAQESLGAIADEAIKQPDRFRVKMQEDDQGRLAAIVEVNTAPKGSTEEDFEQLTSIMYQPEEKEKALEYFDISPQIYLTDALQKIFAMYQAQGTSFITEDPKTNLLLEALFQD